MDSRSLLRLKASAWTDVPWLMTSDFTSSVRAWLRWASALRQAIVKDSRTILPVVQKPLSVAQASLRQVISEILNKCARMGQHANSCYFLRLAAAHTLLWMLHNRDVREYHAPMHNKEAASPEKATSSYVMQQGHTVTRCMGQFTSACNPGLD